MGLVKKEKARPPDKKIEIKLSRRLVFKHKETIQDTNNSCSYCGYQPHGPGAAGKKTKQIHASITMCHVFTKISNHSISNFSK